MRSMHNTYVQIFTSKRKTIKICRLISMYEEMCLYRTSKCIWRNFDKLLKTFIYFDVRVLPLVMQTLQYLEL